VTTDLNLRNLQLLVTEPIHSDGVDLLRTSAISVHIGNWPSEDVDAEAVKAHAIITRLYPLSRDLLLGAGNLRVIGKHGAGLDNIDIEAATERGIPVVFTPETTTEAVAEFTVMQLLRLARNVRSAENQLKEGQFDRARRSVRTARELRGRTLGLVGFGRIGRRVAEIATALGMRVLVFDPYHSWDSPSGIAVEALGTLDELVRQIEFLSIHVPLTRETRGMIGAQQLEAMQPGSYLINCARGGLVDEEALTDALLTGRLAGAAIDAFVVEPPAKDDPLIRHETVLATPHIAGGTEESLRDTSIAVASRVLEVLRGETPAHVANPEVFKR
jgi:D-3-phosphoglycerate dehydrogenase